MRPSRLVTAGGDGTRSISNGRFEFGETTFVAERNNGVIPKKDQPGPPLLAVRNETSWKARSSIGLVPFRFALKVANSNPAYSMSLIKVLLSLMILT